jgi:hypothetical protein
VGGADRGIVDNDAGDPAKRFPGSRPRRACRFRGDAGRRNAMDEGDFDRWTQILGARLSRRRTAISAGGIGVLAALGLADTMEAKKKGKKKKKKKKRKNTSDDIDDAAPPSATCIEITQECSGSGCCPGLDCSLVFNSAAPLGPRCCRSAGECRFAADCCRGTYCGGGECVTCKGEGEECASGQCCPGFICFAFIPTEPGECIRSD